MMLILLIIFVTGSSALQCDGTNDQNSVKRLKNKLFCDYDKTIRPGSSSSTTVVSSRMNVKDFEYYENSNVMQITAWLTLGWEDKRLAWNKDDYSGLETIHMKSDSLWSPDLKVYNAYLASSLGECEVVDCLITYSARVACVQPCSFRAHCKDFGILNWPYDVQNCSFTFGNWMKSGEEINFNVDKTKLVTARTKKNQQWKLLAATQAVNKGIYSTSNETYPSLSFAFVIERHNGIYGATTAIAAICLIIFNLSVFYFTPGDIMRLLMCGGILIANMLYLDFLYWMTFFAGDEIPKVMSFFTDMHLVTTFILIQSVILRIILDIEGKPGEWVEKMNQTFITNRVGEILIKDSSEKLPDDITSLMENIEKSKSYFVFCRIIDVLTFLVMLITFVIMFIALFPKGYLSFDYDPIESLS